MGEKTLQEKAYDQLKEKIMTGVFRPDEIYSETKLAKEMGISRTPFRNALVRLSQDRYLDILPSKGFKLHQLSMEDAWNTYQVRSAIEGYCAVQLASSKRSKNGVNTLLQLKHCLNCMQEAIDDKKGNEIFLKHDLRFHRILVEFSQNTELMQMYSQYTHRLYSMAYDSISEAERPKKALEEHQAIYDSILNAKNELDSEVYKAVLTHLENSRDLGIEAGKLAQMKLNEDEED